MSDLPPEPTAPDFERSSEPAPAPVDHAQPVLLYDGECGFCKRWIARWTPRLAGHVEILALQEADERFPWLEREALERAIHLVEPPTSEHPRGRTTAGAEAVARALAVDRPGRVALSIYRRVPLVAPVAERAYALVARHRVAASRVSRLLYGPSLEPSRYRLTRWVVLRALGLVHLVAFLSVWAQVHGLVGAGGILPAAPALAGLRERAGGAAWLEVPTLFWLGASDGALHAACAAGCALAVLLVLGLVRRLALLGLWALYLSIVAVGGDFFRVQWDLLLLEATLLAALWAPGGLRPKLATEREPARLARWLVWWLVFRLMVTSGLVKLTTPGTTAGSPSEWWDLTALTFHYETQPLPNPLSWYAHGLPGGVQAACAVALLAIEIGAPFALLLPRRPRHLAAAALVALQIAIAATGNFGIFNLLTVVLCLALVDDRVWRRVLPRRLTAGVPERSAATQGASGLGRVVLVGFALVTVPLTAARMHDRLWPSEAWLRGGDGHLARVDGWTRPFRSFNPYGFLPRVQTNRAEISIEGSADGEQWRPYVFRWKPGALDRTPPQVAPHMPRLDWQMGFLAPYDWRGVAWYRSLLARLLDGEAATLALFAENPFPDGPPEHVRAVLYDYRFTTPAERAETGAVWKRSELGFYTPPMTRRR